MSSPPRSKLKRSRSELEFASGEIQDSPLKKKPNFFASRNQAQLDILLEKYWDCNE